jgi:hypothetical protein
MTTEMPNRPALVELLAQLRRRPASPVRDRAIAKVERQLAALGK